MQTNLEMWDAEKFSNLLKSDRHFKTIGNKVTCNHDSQEVCSKVKTLTVPKANRYLGDINNFEELEEICQIFKNAFYSLNDGIEIPVLSQLIVDHKNRIVRYSYNIDFVNRVIKEGYFRH